ncbi:Quinate/shikimate dehydrogenase (quinone) (plasmid) [Sulfitobacter sp. THAF37]|uniref:glucose dehydrogenase n=1 Tax=Sulfitobacter sp. THAF37 TaxID=2587855 RepID=UPI001268ACED|nr:glucose dehydrogenase [Sulfitobacter sp. THAF37]QFT61134.1 Quinate/shikimate dehydrogenase (quinone) [Sulfitobacter sp. THAF37]
MPDTTALPNHPDRHRTVWGVKILGWISILLGALIFCLGTWLILLGGSWYYGLAGLGLFVTGVLLNRYMMGAVWVYLAVWIGTVIWAWWEVGTDWWAQVPRLVAPTLILIFVLLCIPALSRHASKTFTSAGST